MKDKMLPFLCNPLTQDLLQELDWNYINTTFTQLKEGKLSKSGLYARSCKNPAMKNEHKLLLTLVALD